MKIVTGHVTNNGNVKANMNVTRKRKTTLHMPKIERGLAALGQIRIIACQVEL